MGAFAEQVGALVLWVSLGLLAYTYVGYAMLVGLLSKVFGKAHRVAPIEPTVSLLVPARNEAEVIEAKIRNSLSLDYPKEKLQICVISDASTDGTDEIVREYESQGVELHRLEVWSGKPSALNSGVLRARGEILLLCDANTMFARDAVRCLVRHFADADVGAVTGFVRLRCEETTYGTGESLFYILERFLQRCECKLWSAIGVDGGMYALRKDLYVPIRSDTLLDDFAIAMSVARAGSRVIYDPGALAVEDAVQDPAQEFRRRTRTAAGGFQSLLGGLGRPRWSQTGLWLGYVSHKLLRWIGPFLLILALAGNATVALSADQGSWRRPFYWALLGTQIVLYGAALVGLLLGRRRLPSILAAPYCFCLANAAVLVGFVKWLLRLQPATWTHADRGRPVDPA